jgi:hypothetical protein
MGDLEDKMNEALSGKFYWEHTADLEECRVPEVIDIRRAQRGFLKQTAKNAVIRSGKSDPNGVDSVHHISYLADMVAKAHGCGVFELLEKNHLARLSAPKQHYNWGLLRYYPTYSASRLAKMVNRDQATITHGARRFQVKLHKYAEQIRMVDEAMWSK